MNKSDERVGLFASARNLPDHIFFREKSAHLASLRRAASQSLERERAFYRTGKFGKTDDRTPFARRIDVPAALIADHLQGGNVLEPRLEKANGLRGQEQSLHRDGKAVPSKVPGPPDY